MEYAWKELTEALNTAIRQSPETECHSTTIFMNTKGTGYIMIPKEVMRGMGWELNDNLLLFNDYGYCSLVKSA